MDVLGNGMDFLQFQFLVDNASSIERSVALLYAQYPQRSEWILQYVHETHQPLLHNQLVLRFVKAEIDICFLRELLWATQSQPNRTLLCAACETNNPMVLDVLLEMPNADVDDWMLSHIYNHPTLSEWPALYQQLLDYHIERENEPSRRGISDPQSQG